MLSRLDGLAAMREMGVRVPAMMAVESKADVDKAIAAYGFPLVLKADQSWGGSGVAIARTREEAVANWRKLSRPASRLRSLVRTLRRRDAHFLLEAARPKARRVSAQSFVAGKLAASAFAANKGEITGFFSYDILESHDSGMGPPKLVRRLDCPEMRNAATMVARRFGLSGAHGLDFIRDDEGHAHLIEINPRATQGGTLAFGRGQDIPFGLASILMPAPRGVRKPRGDEIIEFNRSVAKPEDSVRTFVRAPGAPVLEAQ
jgi:biotin carboxylase